MNKKSSDIPPVRCSFTQKEIKINVINTFKKETIILV